MSKTMLDFANKLKMFKIKGILIHFHLACHCLFDRLLAVLGEMIGWHHGCC